MQPIPPSGATYRFQLNGDFTFAQAAALPDYLQELGVTDLYLSPILTARPGSIHGYDVVDPTALNPELGGDSGFRALSEEARGRGMGLVVDIVPNHMCVAVEENQWWQDVLAAGPHSAYADFFDIDWQAAPDLRNKVLLPILGDALPHVLAAGHIAAEVGGCGFHLRVYDRRLPLAPHSWDSLVEQAPLREVGTLPQPLLEAIGTAAAAVRRGDSPGVRVHGTAASAAFREWWRRPETPREAWRAALAHGAASPQPGSLAALLEQQFYRLAPWRDAGRRINYRRFFDVHELAGVRAEHPPVFAATHGTILRLVGEGHIGGLRIDHPDGLADPGGYLMQLQQACLGALGRAGAWQGPPPFYVVAEKILCGEETLPPDWPVRGTTGYDFLNRLNGVFIHRGGEAVITAAYRAFTGHRESAAVAVAQAKREVIAGLFGGELERLTAKLVTAGQALAWRTRRPGLRSALVELLVALPVYRTYRQPGTWQPQDRQVLESAFAAVAGRRPPVAPKALALLRETLLPAIPPGEPHPAGTAGEDFITAFQQLSGPVMAKGVEDTALYRHIPLVSLNEVGSEPGEFGCEPAALHDLNGRRGEHFPCGLSATATHDTKWGEDLRARLNALSEMGEGWSRAVRAWAALNQPHKKGSDGAAMPDAHTEYRLYQTLVGAWPPDLPAEAPPPDFVARIQATMLKALREAKQHTSWRAPDAAFEEATASFVAAILAPGSPFLPALRAFLPPLQRAGMYNALSQTLLKIASPGLPDFFQGSELWDFRLVDPDNRRPVDFTARREVLAHLERESAAHPTTIAGRLLERCEDGAVKLFVIRRALALRRAHRELFAGGEYLPLQAQGPRADHVIAFARALRSERVIAVAGRFYLLLNGGAAPVGRAAWAGTTLPLPQAWRNSRLRDVLTGRVHAPAPHEDGWHLPLATVLTQLPVALLAEETP